MHLAVTSSYLAHPQIPACRAFVGRGRGTFFPHSLSGHWDPPSPWVFDGSSFFFSQLYLRKELQHVYKHFKEPSSLRLYFTDNKTLGVQFDEFWPIYIPKQPPPLSPNRFDLIPKDSPVCPPGQRHPPPPSGQPLTCFPSLEMTSVIKKRLGHYVLKGDGFLLPSSHHRNKNKP